MASSANHSKSTPRKVKALLSSFIYGSLSGDDQCSLNCEGKNQPVLPSDEIDGWSQKGDLPADHKRIFHPENKVAFYKRVQTYTPFSWFDPLTITTLSPLECSRYGWENIDVNTLKCVSCKEVLYVGIPDSLTFEQDASKNLIESISTAHSSICPWPTSPSPEKFYIVVETTAKSTALEFVKRVESVIKTKDSLPKLDLDFITSEDMDLTDVTNAIQKTYRKFQETVQLKDDEICVAAFLALFGWTNSEEDGSSVIVCNHCKRHAGMWNFTSLKKKQKANGKTDSPGDGGDGIEPETKRRRLMELEPKTFNPATEHRNWCPWISSTNLKDKQTPPDNSNENLNVAHSLAGGETDSEDQVKQILELVNPSAAGWKQVLQMLKRNLEDASAVLRPTLANTTPPSQAWKTVKRILGFFQGKSPGK